LVIVVPHKGLTGVFLYNVFKIQRHDEFWFCEAQTCVEHIVSLPNIFDFCSCFYLLLLFFWFFCLFVCFFFWRIRVKWQKNKECTRIVSRHFDHLCPFLSTDLIRLHGIIQIEGTSVAIVRSKSKLTNEKFISYKF
jgi:hypothetical protein